MQLIEYKNSKGTFWQARGYLGIDKTTGKEIEFNKRGFKTKKEAQIAFSRALHEFDEGTYGKMPKAIEKLTYRDVYKEWFELYKDTVKESTAVKTETHFRIHILPAFGDYRIQKITTAMLQKELNVWHKKYISYRKFYNIACMVFRYAFNHNYISVNPADKITMPTKKVEYSSTHEREKIFYSLEELKHVLEVIKQQNNSRWYTFFRLLAFTGLRKGEALALTWKDINFKDKTLEVNKTLAHGHKNKLIIQEPKTESSNRVITLDDTTLAVLSNWRMEQRSLLLRFGHNANKPTQLIFSKYERNTFMDLSAPRNFFYQLCENNNLEFIHIHGFRHTHCSLLFESGVPMKDVKERLGHSDIQTTMNIYTHVTKDSKNKSAELFARYANF